MPLLLRLVLGMPLILLVPVVGREGQGFSKPPGFGEGYGGGRGKGTDFATLHKPLPVAGVSGVSEGYWCCIFSVRCVALCVDVCWELRELGQELQDWDVIAIECILILRTLPRRLYTMP